MRAILVHGWKGWPYNAWFPWLRRELEGRSWTTKAPAMPTPAFPKRREWIKTIRSELKGSDMVLIGHSLGCLAILWALEEYDGPPIIGAVCVSGFGRMFAPIRKYRKAWFPHEPDLHSIKRKSASWIVVHARNDQLVPFQEGEWLAERLGAALIIPERGGHLTHEEGAFEVPEILNAITQRLL